MPRPFAALTVLLLLCGAVLPACETPDTKSKGKSRTIDRQGLQAIGVLGHYLFPVPWDEGIRVAMARRMFPLEYHGNASGGKTLIQSKVEFDAAALRTLLADVQRSTASFRSGADAGGPFASDVGAAVAAVAADRDLPWWKPGKDKNATHYHWIARRPNEPDTRVWLEVTDGKRNVKVVYVWIESA